MIWKPKEKELTREEIIILASKELERYWFGCLPQIMGVRKDDHYTPYPLDPKFLKTPWLIFFLDPTEYAYESVLIYAKEWNRRFTSLSVSFLLVITSQYDFFKSEEFIKKFSEENTTPFPTVFDTQNTLKKSFQIQSDLPTVLLFDKMKILFKYEGQEWVHKIEPELHQFLRMNDPGLALLPYYQPIKEKIILNQESLRFNNKKDIKNLTSFIQLKGAWEITENFIIPKDSSTTLEFESPAPFVALIAQPLTSPTPKNPIEILVEINGEPVYDSIAGSSLILDESGQTRVHISYPKLYPILQDLPLKERRGVLRFPSANETSVAILGLHFGNSDPYDS